jgi:antirestriction protein ArdC
MRDSEIEALNRAKASNSLMNYSAIINGFSNKGIAQTDILPRENVFTFNAWRALGRTVKRGEHGVKVITWITYEKDGETHKRPSNTTVFHISQTEAINQPTPKTILEKHLATQE